MPHCCPLDPVTGWAPTTWDETPRPGLSTAPEYRWGPEEGRTWFGTEEAVDRLAIMDEGRVVAEGTPEAVALVLESDEPRWIDVPQDTPEQQRVERICRGELTDAGDYRFHAEITARTERAAAAKT